MEKVVQFTKIVTCGAWKLELQETTKGMFKAGFKRDRNYQPGHGWNVWWNLSRKQGRTQPQQFFSKNCEILSDEIPVSGRPAKLSLVRYYYIIIVHHWPRSWGSRAHAPHALLECCAQHGPCSQVAAVVRHWPPVVAAKIGGPDLTFDNSAAPSPFPDR